MKDRLTHPLSRIFLIILLTIAGYVSGTALRPASSEVLALAPCNQDLCVDLPGDTNNQTCRAPLPTEPVPLNKNCDSKWELDEETGTLVHKCEYKTCGLIVSPSQ